MEQISIDLRTDEDLGRAFMEASSSGDHETLQSLFSQPCFAELMLQEEKHSYSYDHWSLPVTERLPNIDDALDVAIRAGHADIVSLLAAFREEHGLHASFSKLAVYRAILMGHTAVIKIIAERDKSARGIGEHLVDYNYHGAKPLFIALKLRRFEIALILLELGADPKSCHDSERHSSIMSWAAIGGPRIVELVDLPIPGTAALHMATACDHLDSMRILIARGADVDEVISQERVGIHSAFIGCPPMHIAAGCGDVDAMKLLSSYGARSDVLDSEGKSPEQRLEEYLATKQDKP